MELTLDGALKKALDAHRNGHVQEADQFYKAILKAQPTHSEANHNLGILNVGLGNMENALLLFKKALETRPSEAQFWLSYINALIKLERLFDAKSVLDQAKEKGAAGEAFDQIERQISSLNVNSQDPPSSLLQPVINAYSQGLFQQALADGMEVLESFPNSAALYNILGSSHSSLMQFGAAIKNYKKALNIRPNQAETYFNMGNALNSKGDLGAAINCYKQAIEINPKSASAYNNMGNSLKNKGNLEAATDAFMDALIIKPDYTVAKLNLVSLLTTYAPQRENMNGIMIVNNAIRKISTDNATRDNISDARIINLFSTSSQYIDNYHLELRTDLSQTYRRNLVDLNCERHMTIFNEHNIIPEYCFGCYKVQVEPRSIIELIKLLLIFDQLKLHENNIRKCIIELRPEIPGFYKGLIYCSGLIQANEIAEYLIVVVEKSIGLGIPLSVKRGCSEYSISFPNYKEINSSGPQLMNYNKVWKSTEEEYDRKKITHAKESMRSSLSGLSLSDILIIQKWVDYAKGIGDLSSNFMNQKEIYYPDIYDVAKARLIRFNFQN